MSSLHSDLFPAGFHQACGRGDPATENLPASRLRQAVSPQGGLQGAIAFISHSLIFVYFLAGYCVLATPFAYVAHFVFLRDV
jgi:hypothetical protein